MATKLPLVVELNKKGYMWGRVEGVGNYVPKGEGETYTVMLENVKENIKNYASSEGKDDDGWSKVDIESIEWETYIDRSGTETGNVHPVIKMWFEYENLNNEQYSLILQRKIKVLLELVNEVHERKGKVDDVTVWIEPLLFKFCFHATSTINLFFGTVLPIEVNNKPFLIFDEPSMMALFRSSLENYLTFFYLYADNVSKEERDFRTLIFRYSGIKQRSEFLINTEVGREKQKVESAYCNKLKAEIISSPYFLKYDKGEQKQILMGKKPRLLESWKSLVEKSKLHSELFRNIYSYKSIYSHSEFISLLQMKESNYGYSSNSNKSHYLLLLLHGLICKAIIESKDLFPESKAAFEELSENCKDEINCIYEFIIGKAPFQDEVSMNFT